MRNFGPALRPCGRESLSDAAPASQCARRRPCTWSRRSCGSLQEFRQRDQVVGRKRQGELPVYPRQSAMPGLRETRHRPHPAEDLPEPFTMNLARPVGLTRHHLFAEVRAPARVVARRIRLDAEGRAGPDELRRVIGLVRAPTVTGRSGSFRNTMTSPARLSACPIVRLGRPSTSSPLRIAISTWPTPVTGVRSAWPVSFGPCVVRGTMARSA